MPIALSIGELQYVIYGPSAGIEADDVNERERAFDHGRQRFADRHIFPVQNRAAATEFVAIESGDFLDLLVAIAIGRLGSRVAVAIFEASTPSRAGHVKDVAQNVKRTR